jgi:hypothetical protein
MLPRRDVHLACIASIAAAYRASTVRERGSDRTLLPDPNLITYFYSSVIVSSARGNQDNIARSLTVAALYALDYCFIHQSSFALDII